VLHGDDRGHRAAVILDRLGKDPAFGSGPLPTVIQDLLSIAIYFQIAGAVLG
jgi:magnesium transporter